jgi:hypothetical protein
VNDTPNEHLYECMEELALLECEECDAAHPPSVYAAVLDTSPSGNDLFGVFQCPVCDSVYGIAFDGAAFMAWYNTEMLLHAREEQNTDIKDHQRWKSQLGREVASFRRELELVATVEDMWTT